MYKDSCDSRSPEARATLTELDVFYLVYGSLPTYFAKQKKTIFNNVHFFFELKCAVSLLTFYIKSFLHLKHFIVVILLSSLLEDVS